MIKCTSKNIHQKGVTLIEVILSIALLAIISIAFFTMFTNGLVDISKSGSKSISHYEAQDNMESNINSSVDLQNNAATSTINIRLTFPANYYDISGRQIDVPYKYGSLSKKLTTFTTN